MSRLFAACLTIVIGLTVSACATRLSPTWTINERTPVTSDVEKVGLAFPAADTTGSAMDPRDSRSKTVAVCGPSTVKHIYSRGALRPGLGSHLQVDYWTTSATTIVDGPWAAVMPTIANFDGILRKVPADGRLSGQEKMLLGTFLAVNRTFVSRERPSKVERETAARIVDRYQAKLWNAFVENFCVEFIASPTETDTSVLLFKSDSIRLCEALRDKVSPADLEAYSRVFVYIDQSGTRTIECEKPKGQQGGPGSAPTLPPGQSTLLGTLQDSARNTLGQVAAGIGAAQGATTFYVDVGLQIAALGDITLQQLRFGAPGTETWSLADWEESGVCVGLNGEELSVARVILRGGARFAIKDEGNYRVVRRVTEAGYVARVESVGDRPHYPRSLSRTDLAHLSPTDVVDVQWNSKVRGRNAAICSKRL
jgi:hypothetical protein